MDVTTRFLWVPAALALTTPMAQADDFDFEAGLNFFGERFESEADLIIPASPFPVSTFTAVDSDEIAVFGRWFFHGLSDDEGPRARAVFVNRASSLNLNYVRSESTASAGLFSQDPAFSPIALPDIDLDIDSFSVDARFVSRQNGWFGEFGIAQARLNSDFIGESFDATTLSAGIGKYVAKTTALEVNLATVDADQGDATTVAVNFTHLGAISPTWQYAIDGLYSNTNADGDGDSDSWRLALSLYPNKDVEFGIAFDGTDQNTAFGNADRTGFQLFASWFITANFQIGGSYRFDDADELPFNTGGTVTNTSTDQYAFSAGATLRF